MEITHGHLFCGDGGGAVGFNAGHVRVGSVEARFRCLGGIDSDPTAIQDFGRFAGVPGTLLDLFDREQYQAHHGKEPPPGWTEATPAHIVAAFGGERPDIGFTSPPCTGFSGLLSADAAASSKYQALNQLALRGIRLLLDAYADDPIPLLLMENVPRIQTRGRELLDDIRHELELAGYAVAETTHDCGELGGLAQHRKRFLLVARHRERVRPFVYVPQKRLVRGIGEVIGQLPMPDAPGSGPMHRCPRLTWKTWLRLALIPAGRDWRALRDLDTAALRIEEYHRGGHLGVVPWDQPLGAVSTEARPSNGAFAVGDVRMSSQHTYGTYRVVRWTEPSATVTALSEPGSGGYTVADIRGQGERHNNVFRVARWTEPSPAVTAGGGPSSGGLAVGDLRVGAKEQSENFVTGGHYGVLPWSTPSGAVTSSGQHDNGAWSVADPRSLPLDVQPDPYPFILSLEGTWNRPLTTLDLAVIQGHDAADLMASPLAGSSHTEWRRHIGNRVPPPAAQACAEVFGEALIRHRLGEGFRLDTCAVWVRRLLAAVDSAVTG